jgi:hypothetical protein
MGAAGEGQRLFAAVHPRHVRVGQHIDDSAGSAVDVRGLADCGKQRGWGTGPLRFDDRFVARDTVSRLAGSTLLPRLLV